MARPEAPQLTCELNRLSSAGNRLSCTFRRAEPHKAHRRSDTGSSPSMDTVRKRSRHKSAKVGGSVENLLEDIVGGRNALKFAKDAKLYSQGDPANSMYFIRTGKVKVTVASAHGKKAVLA